MNEPVANAVTKATAVLRGLAGRCPKCGQGRLYHSYLKPNPICSVCGEDLSKIRADDGPAWLTIIVTGHVIVPSSIYFSMHEVLPKGLAMGLLLAATIALALAILPRAKGAFIGMLWYLKEKPRSGDGKYAGITKIP